MDGDIHSHRRRRVLRRLCIYLAWSGIVMLTILPLYNWIGSGSDVMQTTDVVNMSANHSVITAHTVDLPPVDPSGATAPLPESSQRIKPVVKVKIRYHEIINQASTRYGVESAMIKAIIMAESGYNPKAVSNRGAAGLMQLMPTTADAMGVEDRFDPKHNIDGGVRYFKRLLVRFEGDIRLALAAYNAGAERVKQHNGIPPFKTTRAYIEKVFQYYQRYKALEKKRSNRVSLSSQNIVCPASRFS